MSLNVGEFLLGLKEKRLGVFVVKEVEPPSDKEALYCITIDAEVPEEIRAKLIAEGKISEEKDGTRVTFYAEWDDDNKSLRLSSLLSLTDFGPVNLKEAVKIANEINGRSDRISTLSAVNIPRAGTSVLAKFALIVPYPEQMEEKHIEFFRSLFANNFVRFVVECQYNLVEMTMRLKGGRKN